MIAYVVFDELNFSKITPPQLSFVVKGLCRKADLDVVAKVIRDNRRLILSQSGFSA